MSWGPWPSAAKRLCPQATPAEDEFEAVVDEFIESYVFWREACEWVSAAYRSWATCEPPQRGLAFEGYRAALAREELAAQVHSDRAARARALRS